MDLSKPFKTCSKLLDILRKEDLHASLSEKKKTQIVKWLMTNSPDSLSDSSCSNIPPSTRNSIDSGNSSLERLERNYETPNNRERINKVQIDKKQTTIVNSDKFCTPDRPKSYLKMYADKKASSINTPENTGMTNYADILDKLYGNSWRNKANVLLPTTEPRKTCNQVTSRIIQTERKSKNKYYITDSDSDKSDLVTNNVKLNRGKNIQQKQRKVDSFINDESLSSDSESMYHTALTNPRTSTNRASKPMPVSASIKKLQALCDTDTEDENDKSSKSKKNIHRRRLSFSNDESSNTSEFDPGDYVPPKNICKKEATRIPQQSRIRSIATDKSVGYKSFLTSLSNMIPISNTHPDAKKYRLDYKNNKEELCKELYKLYNEKVFDNQLPQDVPIEWNIRMRGTAGFCYNKKSVRTLSGVVRSSRIVLATKILDTPDRLRDTLIHEMCHAAAWLINNVSDGHGPFWTKCIGRHSKSLDIENKRCGHCFGKFELLINKMTKSGVKQVQTPKREPSGFALYVKQNYNSVKKEKNNMKHADVMKLLEAKRVPLQTLEFPESLGHATKKEKKGNMGKQLAPSFRFTLTLPESNEKTCPEFNYSQLLKTAEKKRRKEQKDGEENATNGLDPFDDDDEDKLRDMAKRFEAKYGTSTMGKKRHKYDDYVDLGAGYDENDSFIDNTDAYDEIVPEEMTTAHGGFYINCGALEFRAADRHSLVHNNNNNNNSDDDESSESSEEDTEDVDSPKRIDKRTISSSDDDETEDITSDNPRKRRKIEESGEKKSNHENNKKRKKPPNHQTQDAQQNSQQDLDILRRKEKNETTDAEGGTASEDQEEKKKPDKIEKSKISEKKFDIKKFEKKSSNSNGYDAKKIDLKRLCGKDSNIDDAIESVVNAARGVEDDSSRDTTDSGKSRVCLYVESDGEEMENKEASLPENLPEDIKEIVNKLKIQAENSKDSKSKFFNSAINEVLFK
ncbi:acidic repeat-containing protein [Lasius niger]|uniref:Acidic repeat-containing protein n=1 Tax=Lasius niger TaxID=67767 RepID=A0A0J7KUN8_LASNI|nr:acidic repeat-containing protein [Lasius niger]